MLIIEGSDCLGKSTVAKRMIELTRSWPVLIMYAHMSKPNDGFDFHHDYEPHIRKHVIQDRFHLGGIVYHDAISPSALQHIQRCLDRKGAKVVVFYAESDAWYHEKLMSDDRGNMYGIDRMIEANRQFRRIAHGTHPLDPRVDWAFDISQKYLTDFEIVPILKSWRVTQCIPM